MTKTLNFFCFLIGLILLTGTFSCKKKERLIFEISNFKNIDRVDTLEVFPEKGIYMLGLVRNYSLGHFTYDLGLLKELKNGKQILYESKINPNILRISSEYLAFVDYEHGFHNVDWYYVKNKQIQDTLPGLRKLKDSIEQAAPKGAFVALTKSYITVYSKPEKWLYYEEFVLKDKDSSLKDLDYGLYILENQTLKKVSNNGEDVHQKSDGIFYIPKPGLGITHKWKKSKVLQSFDSVSNQQTPSRTFSIDQND
jgi:hypothetical protein